VTSLAATLRRASDASGTPLELGPDGPGWMPAAELAVDRERLGDALDRIGAEMPSDRADVCAQRLVEIWAWYLAAAPAAMLLAEGRLPDLSPDRVHVRLASGPTFTAFALAADERAPRGPGAAGLAADLAAHLEPLVETLNALSGRPRRALWRGGGDRLVAAFLWAGEALGRHPESVALAREALAEETPLRGPVKVAEIDVGGNVERIQIRNGCCIWHVCAGAEVCLTCPILCEDERAVRTREWLAERDGAASGS